ncbi:MAG: hypothetical protein ACE5KT_06100 [Methanosarcinales archaeon]
MMQDLKIIKLYRDIETLSSDELETLLLMMDSELTKEILIRREESKIALNKGGLLSNL